MPTFTTPDNIEFNVSEQLLLEAHAARSPNNRPLLLGPNVTHYNYVNPVSLPRAHSIQILNLSDIEANFADRLHVYDDARLRSILSAGYGGTNLPPVTVIRTFRHPPYSLQGGYHRFIGSIIMGFSQIPCVVPDLPASTTSSMPKYIPPHLRPKKEEKKEEKKEGTKTG